MSEAYSQNVEGMHAETSGPEVQEVQVERSGGPMATTVDRVEERNPLWRAMAEGFNRHSEGCELMRAAIRRAAESVISELPVEVPAGVGVEKDIAAVIERHVRRELGL